MEDKVEQQKCRVEIQALRDYREDIPEIVDRLVATCNRNDCFDHVGPEPIPSRNAMIEIIHKLQLILFPGYFIHTRLDKVNLPYCLGQETISLFEELSREIALCIRHDCIRYDLPCTHCQERGHEEAMKFIRELPTSGFFWLEMCGPPSKETLLRGAMMRLSSAILDSLL